MGIDTKEVAVYIKKGLLFSMRTSYKSARDHPFVLGALVFLLLLYRLLPSLFVFLVSSSPVIVCTMLLLGALLSFGQPNIPEIEEEEKGTYNISSLQVGGIGNDLVVKKDEGFSIERLVEDRREIADKAINESDFSEPKDILGSHVEREVLFSTALTKGEEIAEATISASSAAEEDKKEIQSERLTDETEGCDHKCFEKIEFHEERLLEGASDLHDHVDGFSAHGQNEAKGLNMDTDEPTLESCFGLDSSWKSINGHDGFSDSGSDCAESSSPDASMADIIPMLDELHPLLDSGSPLPAQKPAEDSDDASEESSMDQESDDASAESADEKDEHQKEEAQEEKDNGTEVLVQWTADDEKNLMDLGTSELERNQRLENMIAKRRARRNQRVEGERNLIDLDSSNSVPMTEELSYLQLHLPSVSTTRQNPFDLPFDTEASMGLPPIPGSAPSVLLPMKNPFDIPYDRVDESSSLTGESLSHDDFVQVQPKEMIFRRHETFAYGSSFPGDQKEKSDIQLRPLIVLEQMDVEDTRYAQSQGPLSENRNFNMHSVLESESISSVADQTCHRELVEHELPLESVSVSPANHDTKTIDMNSQSSNEADLVEIECQQTITSRTVQEEIRDATELRLPTSDAVNSEAIEHKHYGPGSSSSSEVTEKSFGTTTDEDSINLELARGDSTSLSSDFVQSVFVDSNLLSRSGEQADANQVTEPVYDSSPSAVEKSIPYITSHNDDLLYANTGSFNSTSSFSSDMLVEVSEVGSPSRPIEKNLLSGSDYSVSFGGSTGDELEIGTGGQLMASSDLFSVEEQGSRPREVNEIREHDVIQVGTCGDFNDPLAPMMPESAIDQIVQYSSSNNSDSSDTGTMDDQVRVRSEENEMIDAAAPCSGGLLMSDDLASSASEKDQPSSKKSAVSPSSDASAEEFRVSILPSIPEEEYESTSTPVVNVGVTGLHVIEEHNLSSSDFEQELSFLQGQSTEENDDNINMRKPIHASENVDALVISPVASAPDGGFTSTHILEPTESLHFLNLSGGRSEILDFESTTSSSDLKDKSLFAQIGQEEEKSDVAQDLVDEIKGIDEGMLSELDVVGDFHFDELRPDERLIEQPHQSDIDMSNDGADSLTHLEAEERIPQLQVPETRQVEDINISLKQHSEEDYKNSGPLHSSLDQPKVMESEDGTSNSGLSAGDPEAVRKYSGLHDFEARSLDDIDLTFRKLQKGGVEVPIFLELTADNPVLAATPDGSAELILVGSDITKTDSEMPVFDAKSVEDNESAFKKLKEGTVEDKQVLKDSEVGHSKLLLNETDSETLEVNSDLSEVEASSLDDIHLAMKKLSEGTEMGRHLEKSASLVSSDAEPVVIESKAGPSKLLLEVNCDLQEVEASSLDDIHLALKKLSEGTINNTPVLLEPRVCPSEVGETERNLETSVSLVSSDADPVIIESEAAPSEFILEVNSDLQEVEARSLEEPKVSSSEVGETERHPEKSDSLVSSDAEPVVIEYEGGSSDVLLDKTDLMPMEIQSDLHEVKARSLEDLQSAFKHLSEDTMQYSPEVMEPKDGSSEVVPTERHLEPNALDVPTAEEIELAYKEAVAREAGASEQWGKKSNDGVEEVVNGSASASGESQKKEKSDKSDSSTSSSSSDTD